MNLSWVWPKTGLGWKWCLLVCSWKAKTTFDGVRSASYFVENQNVFYTEMSKKKERNLKKDKEKKCQGKSIEKCSRPVLGKFGCTRTKRDSRDSRRKPGDWCEDLLWQDFKSASHEHQNNCANVFVRPNIRKVLKTAFILNATLKNLFSKTSPVTSPTSMSISQLRDNIL